MICSILNSNEKIKMYLVELCNDFSCCTRAKQFVIIIAINQFLQHFFYIIVNFLNSQRISGKCCGSFYFNFCDSNMSEMNEGISW